MNEILFETLTIGFCILTAFYIINRFHNHKKFFTKCPPLVHYKYPIIGHSWDYQNENFLLKCRKEYGEIYSLYIYGRVVTVVGKELGHEVFNSKDASFIAAFNETIPIKRILGLPSDDFKIMIDITKNVFIGQMHLFTKRIQQLMYKDIDELIGECMEPKVIRHPRQVILTIMSRVVTRVLVGEELCRDKDLIDIFMNFSDEIHKLLLVPEYLGYIHPWLFQQRLMMKFKFGNNRIKEKQKIVIEKIKPIIEARLEQEHKYGNAWKPPVDCIQFLLSQPYINKDDVDYVLISGQLLEITFASISTTVSAAENFLLDFATKPEYWNDLLEEQEKVNPNNDREINLDQVSKMEKLDSFLKESLRLFGTLLSIHHKVTGPEFIFSNGYQIPKGSYIFIDLKNTHEDKVSYGPDPNRFDGYRHLGNSPTCQVSRNFIIFGLGRHACPGRNFAVNVVKIFISILIKKYKILTESGTRPPNILYRGLAFPNPEPLIFEKREK